jgi:hypothetical protein
MIQQAHCIIATSNGAAASSLLPVQETLVRVAGYLTFPQYSLPGLQTVGTRRQHCWVQSHLPAVRQNVYVTSIQSITATAAQMTFS